MNMKVLMTVIILGLIITASNLAEQGIEIKKHAFQLSFETIQVADTERMGMVGLHVNLDQYKWSRLYLGVGGYGALTGDRGGFFTAGITPGLQLPLYQQWQANIGIFLGGGGGASAFPGDGAMIRTHAYLGRDFNRFSTWLGVSSQRISNVTLGKTMVWAISKPFFSAKPTQKTTKNDEVTVSLRTRKVIMSPSIAVYYPADSAKGRDNQALDTHIALLGMDVESGIRKGVSAIMSLYAAHANKADGYGKIMAGLGYRYQMLPKVWLYPYAQYGMSGGGNIHTGGGLIWQMGIRAMYDITPYLQSQIVISQIESRTGTFKAMLLGAGFSYVYPTLEPVITESKTILDYAQADMSRSKQKKFQWFLGNKIVFPKETLRDKSGQPYENYINSIAFGLEFPIKKGLRFITTTYWAYTGDVGAYAEGCFGYVVQKPLLRKWSMYQQTEIGAAGGGGINVNQGTIYQATLGLGYHINNNQTVKAQIGWQGSFDAESFQGIIGILSFDITRLILIQ